MSTFATDAVDLRQEVAERIQDHVRSDRENEVGGVLVGTIRDGRPDVHEALPALEAVGGAAQLTFTHEVWENILSTVDQEHPHLQIVGWYHSHPGHGIFLSTYDQFIHENFFSAPGMVALVVDPRDDDAFGWFGWRDGALARLDNDLPVDRPDRTEVPREVAASAATERADDARATAIRDGAIIFLAVLAVFAIGSWFGGRSKGDLETQLAAERSRTAQAEAEQRNLRTALLIACSGFVDQLDGDVSAAQEATVSPLPSPRATTTEEPTASPSPTEPDPTSQAAAVCSQVLPPEREPGSDAGSLEPSPAASPTVAPSPTEPSTEDLP